MPKAHGEMRKATESLQERQHARIAKTKRSDALVPDAKRLLETVEGVGRQGAVVADALDRQERAIDVITERPHGGQHAELRALHQGGSGAARASLSRDREHDLCVIR